jgi:hypothetical protein
VINQVDKALKEMHMWPKGQKEGGGKKKKKKTTLSIKKINLIKSTSLKSWEYPSPK